MTTSPLLPGQAAVPRGLPDPSALAQLARELYGALPGDATSPAAAAPLGELQRPPAALASLQAPASTSAPHGLQPSLDLAPPGSPLASPAGLGPTPPGTPIPQGSSPGLNLLPDAPDRLPSLAHRVPARGPHAQAGNGLPDTLVTEAPAYLPRAGGGALGVPEAAAASGTAASQHPASPYYFVGETPSPGGRSATAQPGTGDPLEALAAAPFALPAVPGAVTPPSSGATSATARPTVSTGSPQPSTGPLPSERGFYFLDLGAPAHGGPVQGRAPAGGPAVDAHPGFDVHAVRRDFPILGERVNGRPLVWFDNAATTQKPQVVIDRLAHFYAHENSNIHRAAHELAARATDAYEEARERVRSFLNAPEVEEVIFVRGTTEAINLVAKSWGAQHVGAGDEIIVSHLEHHANIVPWQQLAAAKGAKLKVIPVDDDGQVRLDEYRKLLSDRTKIVSVTQVSNALGTVVPVKEIVELAHRAGAKALVDGAQSVSHMPVDVQDLGADFFVFSGHKIFGPTGIGALWGKREVLEDMPPWQGGGNMIADVTFEKTLFQPLPNTFEAGTGNIADAVGLGAALAYVQRLGLANIGRYEHELLAYATACLREVPGVRLVGTAPDKASVLSFVLKDHSTDEVGQALNQEGIAVRTGHHCAQPILRRFGLEATVRPSLAFYNTREEVDRFIAVVQRLARARG